MLRSMSHEHLHDHHEHHHHHTHEHVHTPDCGHITVHEGNLCASGLCGHIEHIRSAIEQSHMLDEMVKRAQTEDDEYEYDEFGRKVKKKIKKGLSKCQPIYT